MVRDALQKVFDHEFRGRAWAWKLAAAISSIVLIARVFMQKPDCEFLFDRWHLALSYLLLWLWVFVFAGLTKWVKLLLFFVTAIVFAAQPLVDLRVPANEWRISHRLQEMHSRILAANPPPKKLTEIVDPAFVHDGEVDRYEVEYTPQLSSAGKLTHYTIAARPSCYCVTGQKSFLINESGTIHFTWEDRMATIQDPIFKLN